MSEIKGWENHPVTVAYLESLKMLSIDITERMADGTMLERGDPYMTHENVARVSGAMQIIQRMLVPGDIIAECYIVLQDEAFDDE